ncbi:hypothetical protein [Rhizobium binxianense]|uniref:hypothetical protein n=1 Tax=Rhizobium binxianense TaxID=3024242 RepID=UPI0023629E67|nr:hypothetical protein [Rhizobium sp. MJ37]MDC9835540.1 hypothetical protein [Rhizobium sp. MJ37]
MAGFDFSRNTEDDRLLMIAFTGERPINAAQTAELLRALNMDYRGMTGRDLVLAHYEVGSTWVWVTEAIFIAGVALSLVKSAGDVASAVNDISEFAKKIREGLKPRSHLPAIEPAGSGDVDRTLLAIANAAIENDTPVKLRKITHEGAIEIEIAVSEAKFVRQRVKDKKKKKKSKTDTLYRAVDIARIAEPLRSLPAASGEMEALIAALVNAHVAYGSVSILRSVAEQLENEGRYDIAEIIRRDLGRRGGTVTVET